MIILEIAKEWGAKSHDVGKREGYLNQLRITFDVPQLEDFAAAISAKAIEDYKASLVPVAFMWDDYGVAKYTNDTDYVGALSKHVFITPLYALPKIYIKATDTHTSYIYEGKLTVDDYYKIPEETK